MENSCGCPRAPVAEIMPTGDTPPEQKNEGSRVPQGPLESPALQVGRRPTITRASTAHDRRWVEDPPTPGRRRRMTARRRRMTAGGRKTFTNTRWEAAINSSVRQGPPKHRRLRSSVQRRVRPKTTGGGEGGGEHGATYQESKSWILHFWFQVLLSSGKKHYPAVRGNPPPPPFRGLPKTM